MNVFLNANFTKRNPDCTNVVAFVADKIEQVRAVAPNAKIVLGEKSDLARLERLWVQGGVAFYGYL